jgi:mannose-6-phosphate isomerase-like protein (cupin superfamily)
MIFTGQIERWREPYQPNPAMLRLILVRQGYEPYQWSERLGTYYGWHFHDEEQVHWIIKGELEVTVQSFGRNYTYRLKAGDRDLMPAGMYHTARVIGETDLLYLIGIKRHPKVEIEVIEEVILIEEKVVVETAPEVKKTKAKAKSTKPKTASKKKKNVQVKRQK